MEPEDPPHEDRCLNCNAQLPETAAFCPRCGQKVADTRVSFWKIAKDALTTVLNLDSLLFRTLYNLLIPGKLTREFFLGRQKMYMNPVRLFLWTTVALIAVITLRTTKSGIIKGNVNDWTATLERSWELRQALIPLDSAMDVTRQKFPRQDLRPAFDTLRASFLQKIPSQEDSIDLNKPIQFGVEPDSFKISMDDLFGLEPDTLLEKYQVQGFANRLVTKQKLKFLRDQKSLGTYLIGKLTWAVFILMPLLAVCLKLLYIRRGFYYVEHLIFAMHTHSMAFMAFILILLGEPVLGDLGSYFGILILLVGLYVLFAQKRFYRQSWWKTSVKFLILQVFYVVLLTVTALATMLIGFFLF